MTVRKCVAPKFMTLFNHHPQIFRDKNFTRCGFASGKTKRSVVRSGQAKLPQDRATSKQCRSGKIIECKGNQGPSQVDFQRASEYETGTPSLIISMKSQPWTSARVDLHYCRQESSSCRETGSTVLFPNSTDRGSRRAVPDSRNRIHTGCIIRMADSVKL